MARQLPTKSQFDLTLVVVVLAEGVWGLFKLWAHRKNASPTNGALDRVAEAVVVAH